MKKFVPSLISFIILLPIATAVVDFECEYRSCGVSGCDKGIFLVTNEDGKPLEYPLVRSVNSVISFDPAESGRIGIQIICFKPQISVKKTVVPVSKVSGGFRVFSLGTGTTTTLGSATTTTLGYPVPFAQWKFDEGTGDVVADSIGSLDGSREGSVSWVSGSKCKSGSCLEFDGTSDRVELPNFDISGDKLTIALFFKSTNLANCASRDCRLISKAKGVQGDDHYWMLSTISSGSDTTLRFRLKTDPGNTRTLIANSGNLQNDEIYCAAAVYDGSQMKLYLDGTQVGVVSESGDISENSNVKVWIGDNPPTAGSRPFKGTIDEVTIWNRGLSRNKIQTYCDSFSTTTTSTTTTTLLASTATYSFREGLNSFGLLVDPGNNVETAEELLEEINDQGGDCDEISRWLKEDDNWESHNLDTPFNNFDIELGEGYLVKCNADSDWDITGNEVSSISMELIPVWSFISIPYEPSFERAKNMLEEMNSQDGDCDVVAKLNNAAGVWKNYTVGVTGNNFYVNGGVGYHIRCSDTFDFNPGPPATTTTTSSTTTTTAGPPATITSTATYSLKEGLNSIGLLVEPGENVDTAEELLEDINDQGGDCDEISRWLKEDDNWESHGLDTPFNDFDIELGEGYLIRCSGDGTWEVTGNLIESITVQLAPVWTYISFPFEPSFERANHMLQEMNSQNGDCEMAGKINSTNDGWKYFTLGVSGNNFKINGGAGYHVKCVNTFDFNPGPPATTTTTTTSTTTTTTLGSTTTTTSGGSTTTTVQQTTTTTLAPYNNDFVIDDVLCDEGRCNITVPTNEFSEDVYVYLFVKNEQGVIYFYAKKKIDWPGTTTGEFRISLREVFECDRDETFDIIVLAYADDDMTEPIGRFRAENLECGYELVR